jgi:hypothetical protein
LFISFAAHLDVKRPFYHSLEGGSLAGSRPQLELYIAARPELQEGIISAIVKIDRRNELRMAAVQTFSQTQNRGKHPDCSPATLIQPPEFVVALAGFRPSMIPRDERHRIDFIRLEPPQITILDQIRGMLVVALVGDVNPDIVKQRSIFQPFSLAIAKPMDGPRLVENRACETGHLRGVLRPVIAPLGQLDHAAAPDVRVAPCLRDLFAVPRDVIENQTFAK